MTTHQKVPFDSSGVRDAIVRVGDGRGCLLARRDGQRIVLTAAHCLPHLPPANGGSFTEERTYLTILGPVGGDASIAAECLYVDPVVDLAVLAPPDNQLIAKHAAAYEEFTEARPALRLAEPRRRSTAWLLSLEGEWQGCSAAIMGRNGRDVTLIDAQLVGGMSGSPVLDPLGRVIGIVGLASENGTGAIREQHWQPIPLTNLPAWLLADLKPSPLAMLPALLRALATAFDASVRRELRRT